MSIFNETTTMEDLCKRIPTLAVKVFQSLNDQDLIKCKESSKVMSSFLGEEQFYAIRIIDAHSGSFIEFQDCWAKVLNTSKGPIIKQLALAVQKFFFDDAKTFAKQWSSFWIAAANGSPKLLKYVIAMQMQNK